MDVLLWYSIFSWVLVCVSVRTNSRNWVCPPGR